MKHPPLGAFFTAKSSCQLQLKLLLLPGDLTFK